MRHGQKYYLGTVDNIIKAAILYDIFSIQMKGIKAKTNFSFTRKELRAVMQLHVFTEIKHSIIKSKKGNNSALPKLDEN
jgi:D-arabinose 1-dehydrogenase-like Zn-dependent alcohol dehydrogenase